MCECHEYDEPITVGVVLDSLSRHDPIIAGDPGPDAPTAYEDAVKRDNEDRDEEWDYEDRGPKRHDYWEHQHETFAPRTRSDFGYRFQTAEW
jgi:hypothetical protein